MATNFAYLQMRYEQECQKQSVTYTETSQWHVAKSFREIANTEWYIHVVF